jgi:hypothetical protein
VRSGSPAAARRFCSSSCSRTGCGPATPGAAARRPPGCPRRTCPLAATVVEALETGELTVDHHGHAGVDALSLVPFEVEGANVAEALPGERALESGDALAIGALRPRALVRFRPGEEFLGGLVEGQILALRPPMPTSARALMHEVESPGRSPSIDAVTASGHQGLPSSL